MNSQDIKLYNDNFNLSQPNKSILYSNEVIEHEIKKNIVKSRNPLTNKELFLNIKS